MLSDWLRGINKELKSLILVGATSMCWAIWLSWNKLVFDKGLVPSYMHVLFRGYTGHGSGCSYRRRRIAQI